MNGKIVKGAWTIVRLALGFIFLYASLYKIQSPGAFAHSIYNFKLLPPQLINPMAITMPWLQFFCGLGLLTNRWPKATAFMAVMMMLTFQTAVTLALFRNLNVSCGCFKSGGKPATWWTVGRDFLITMLALAQFWRIFKPVRSQEPLT